jgi:iron(III) transport system permease protein
MNAAVLDVPATSRPGLRFDAKWLVIGVAVALVAWLSLLPLGFLLWQSILSPQSAGASAQLTLQNYLDAYSGFETYRLSFNSLQFAFGAAIVSFLIGTFFAWLNERTNKPCKPLFLELSIIPLIIPGILFTVSWILLASPKIGIINALLQGWFGTAIIFINVYSMAGMIWVDGLHYSPMAFLLMTAAFRSMDPALEESAQMSGASVPQVFFRVTLKLAWPAVLATLLILFVRAIESFEVPALLGLPVGIEVYTSAIYQAIHRYPSQVDRRRLAVTLLVICSLVSIFNPRCRHKATDTRP